MTYDLELADRVRAVVAADEDLRGWVGHGVTYARSLPPK